MKMESRMGAVMFFFTLNIIGLLERLWTNGINEWPATEETKKTQELNSKTNTTNCK